MPWVIGIDEAGYGPNLGPLAQAAVALKLPDADTAGWDILKPVVRRCGERNDTWRLLIDDSKKIYTNGGLETLEEQVLMAIPPLVESLGALLPEITLPWVRSELDGEAWFDPTQTIPVEPGNDLETVWVQRRTVGDCWQNVNCAFGACKAALVPAPRFNRFVDEYGSKATVLSRGLVELLGAIAAATPDDSEPLLFQCDKQGGRNYYAALVQEAFPEGWVVAERESAEESRYRVENLPREIKITFRPRAEGASAAVALASMLCKYLREVCMKQFNRYWATHVPGIRPTAGYPLDAKRFYAEIRPVMEKLGLAPDQVWRKK